MIGTALVTGASAGIGEEIARVHAEQGGDLILVARRQDRLDALAASIAQEHGVRVDVIAMDLSKTGAAKRLYTKVQEMGLVVDVLVNNAGLGAHGSFHESDLKRQTQMLQVNITALTELTHLFVQDMVDRGAGRILNVGSTAGFLPGPLQAVYYATKAYVNSFSQAIANELEGTGVTVTVLCPGPVATEFQEVADLGGGRALRGRMRLQGDGTRTTRRHQRPEDSLLPRGDRPLRAAQAAAVDVPQDDGKERLIFLPGHHRGRSASRSAHLPGSR